MIWCIANDCNLDAAKLVYHKRVTFLEYVMYTHILFVFFCEVLP